MNTDIAAQDIERQIASDIDACHTLLDLLDQEQEALKARDADLLEQVVKNKMPALSHLEESAKRRASWANITQEKQSSGKWEDFVNSFNQQQLKEHWQELKRLTQQCQQKNEINGKILSRQQQIYGRLVGLLRGQTSAPNLYNAAGTATASRSSIKVDEA